MPDEPSTPLGPSAVEQRFWSKVNKTDTCWLWTDVPNASGYGGFSISGSTYAAHRVAYELVVGPIPRGLVVDHLCRVRHCVNPDHLEAVTQRENCLRGEGVGAKAARQTHCAQGHEFTDENTRIIVRQNRVCKTCESQRSAEWYRRRGKQLRADQRKDAA